MKKHGYFSTLLVGLLACSADQSSVVSVSNINWDCNRRPCHVVFDLKNTASESVKTEIEITGLSINHPQGPDPEPFVSAKRRFFYTLNAGEQKTVSEDVKFTRYPVEIRAQALSVDPVG